MALSTERRGRLLAGRYRIEALVGRGASARVYLATDTQLERRVAVKILHEALAGDVTFLKRFRAEAVAAASLSHPHVMHVYDSGSETTEVGDVPFLVCEYLGGGSLRSVLDAGHRLSPSQALVVGLETARGLDYAHQRGFVHRDIKPANLLFGDDGRLRIADFGVARALAEATWTEPMDVLLGTARYASPEQATGDPVDGRSDVYALGLVLVEAVSGRSPFVADSPAELLRARVDREVEVPAALGRLAPVVERCCRRDPGERYDAGELEIAFMAAAEDLDRPAPVPLVPPVVEGLGPEDVAAGAGEPVTSAVEVEPPPVGHDDPTAELGLGVEAASGGPAPSEETAEAAAEPRRRRWPRVVGGLLLAAVLAAGGWLAWVNLRTPSHQVPNLVGLTRDEAARLVSERKWTLDDSELSRRDGSDPGEVLEQRPAAGRSLDEGRKVSIVVSLGNTLVGLPQVSGAPEADAVAALTAAGLSATVTRANDEGVPKGAVVKVDAVVDAGGQLPRGSSVGLVVSEGPAPRTIPAGLVGQPFEAAAQALGGIQVRVERAEDFSDTVPAGRVIALAPAENTQVARDSAVAVTVSKGPQPIPVPDVTGQAGSVAAEALKAAGFAVSGITGDPTRPVLATDPPRGELHPKGTPVQVITRR